jgi:hypothetical protein
MCRTDPKGAWRFILGVLAADRSDRVMENLAAGPLEDLLARHPYVIIRMVEAEAKTNSHFARLLGGVWQNKLPEDVWQRVQAVWDQRGWDGIAPAEGENPTELKG